MTTLIESDIPAFLDRFNSFNDAVLRELKISYKDNGNLNISVAIATQDVNEKENDGWVCVRLDILNVADFCFSENAKFSNQVLSQGIHILAFSDGIGFDFGFSLMRPNQSPS